VSAFGRTRNLLALIGDATFLADMPTATTTTGITKQNMIDNINAGIAEMFNAACEAGGDEVYSKSSTVVTDGRDPSEYSLASDFYRLLSVELTVNSTDRVLLTKFTLAERPLLASASPGWNGRPYRYRLRGKTGIDTNSGALLELLPLPEVGQTVTYWYVFCPPRLAGDSDTLDGFAGFEDYAINFAARRFALKQGDAEQAAMLMGECERIKSNIVASMQQRDEANPPRVSRTKRTRWGGW
jgi:hypothetical protein